MPRYLPIEQPIFLGHAAADVVDDRGIVCLGRSSR